MNGLFDCFLCGMDDLLRLGFFCFEQTFKAAKQPSMFHSVNFVALRWEGGKVMFHAFDAKPKEMWRCEERD